MFFRRTRQAKRDDFVGLSGQKIFRQKKLRGRFRVPVLLLLLYFS
jgi:hypothetical protein